MRLICASLVSLNNYYSETDSVQAIGIILWYYKKIPKGLFIFQSVIISIITIPNHSKSDIFAIKINYLYFRKINILSHSVVQRNIFNSGVYELS
jgi:hypothetical protein